MINLRYESSRGTVYFSGKSESAFRTREIDGLGLVEREYKTVSYGDYDGRETLSKRALERTITISGDVVSDNAAAEVRCAVDILDEAGYLYISDGETQRRIFCNYIIFPDVARIIRGRLATFAVQFVCDNPYFEDSGDTIDPIYIRTKELSTTFVLPTVFGSTVTEADVLIETRGGIEPKLVIYFSKSLSSETTVSIHNDATDCSITLVHKPSAGEEIVFDIGERTVESSILGNIIDRLSGDTFLGDFVLTWGVNHLSVSVGDIDLGVTAMCVHNNRYTEAMIV